jgi:hypothetical protein
MSRGGGRRGIRLGTRDKGEEGDKGKAKGQGARTEEGRKRTEGRAGARDEGGERRRKRSTYDQGRVIQIWFP